MKRWPTIFAATSVVFFLLFRWHTATLPSDFSISNLENGVIHVLGHGGMGVHGDTGMDTPSSFRELLELGVSGTEMDVQMTSDSVLVAFHDLELQSRSNCNGKLSETTWSALQNCEVDGEKIIRIEDVLKMNWPEKTIFSLDIKLAKDDEAYTSTFVRQLELLVNTIGPDRRILIESMSVPFLVALKNAEVDAELYHYCNRFEDGLASTTEYGFDGISIRNDLITENQIKQAHELGVRVMIWGVGSRWDNRAAVLGSPDIIQSDKVDHLQNLLEKQ